MINSMCRKRTNTQQGAVLLICLILLVAVTILGISSMNMSLVENKIVTNVRNKTLASQGAEAALVEAQAIVEGRAGGGQQGVSLMQIQENDQSYNALDLNASSTQIKLSLNENNASMLTSIILWGKGAVTDNAQYTSGSSGRDEKSKRSTWWENNEHSSRLSIDMTDNDALAHYAGLAENPRYVIEMGEFFPDDLSPGAAAEYRGRQAFIILSRSVGRTVQVESAQQASVLTRYR